MKKLIKISIIAALIMLHPLYKVSGCTIFTLIDTKDKVLFGNNEDFIDLGTRMWFIPSGADYYGAMYVGFINGFAQGGMNEKGLACDCVAGYYSDYTSGPEQKKGVGNLSQRMLETCSTIDEAIAFYREYAEPSFAIGRIFIADKSGSSVIIQANNGELEFVKASASRVLGYGEKAFEEALASNSAPDIDNAHNILQSCNQKGEFATRYSTLYNLVSGDIYIFPPTGGEGVKINLTDELCKGEHYYDIPVINEQIDQAPRSLLPNMKRLYIYNSEPLEEQNTEVAELLRNVFDEIAAGTLSSSLFTPEMWSSFQPYVGELQNTLKNFGPIDSLHAIYENCDTTGEQYHYVIIFDETRLGVVLSLNCEGKITCLEPFL